MKTNLFALKALSKKWPHILLVSFLVSTLSVLLKLINVGGGFTDALLVVPLISFPMAIILFFINKIGYTTRER